MIHFPRSSRTKNTRKQSFVKASASAVIVVVLLFLLIPQIWPEKLWADDLKEYIYMDGRLVVVETQTGTQPPGNVIPAITSFTLSTDSPSPQLSDSNRHANLTIGKTITLNWSSQNAQSCSLFNKGNANSGDWNPSDWKRWANVGVSGSYIWVSNVTGTGLQFQLRCDSVTYHEATATVAMNIYPLPSVLHWVSPYEQTQNGSFNLNGTRSNVTAGFTTQCGYELARYNNANRNSGRTIMTGQYPAPANGPWSGTLSANQPLGDFYSTVSFCLNNDGVHSINEQPVDIMSCNDLVQSCMDEIDCAATCEANMPPNCLSAGGICMDWYNGCVASCQADAQYTCNSLCQ